MSTKLRRVNLPKQNWKYPPGEAKLSKEIASELKSQYNEFAVDRKVNPNVIKEGLRQINFHKEHPDIYKIIEDLCLEYDVTGKAFSGDNFVKYINEKLGDCYSRQGVALLFDALATGRKYEITPEVLEKIAQEMKDDLSYADCQYLMEMIAEPSKNYNIDLDEFYYIMTKKPADVVKITKVTKSI